MFTLFLLAFPGTFDGEPCMKKRLYALLFLFISVAPMAKPLRIHPPEEVHHASYRQPVMTDTAEVPDEHIRDPLSRDKFAA